jgi:thiamine biosynthesis protein ThiI
MNEVLLLKCGELVLKGLNRGRFEDKLLAIVRRRLARLGQYEVYAIQSTLYVEPQEGAPIEAALEVCRKVFGVVAVCRAAVCQKNMEDICSTAVEYLKEAMKSAATFRCQAKRSDKKFPLKSPEIARDVGGALLAAYPHLKVQMDGAQTEVHIEVRDKNAFVYAQRIKGAGGMPTGSNGKALLLLSGGIDSPVAGYIRRFLRISPS